MKISKIMKMIIDPRPYVQRTAVDLLDTNPDLLDKVKVFVLHVEEFGGYSRDEILLKWERRIIRRLDAKMLKRAALSIRMRCKEGKMYVSHKGITVDGPFKTVNEYTSAARRYAERMIRDI